MTDQQLITLAIAIIFPLSMLLYSNSRISDTKETLRSEMQGVRTEIQKDILQLRLDFSERFNSIDRKLDELLKLAADHDQRITRLESHT
jgi:flagellar motor switch protein FliM